MSPVQCDRLRSCTLRSADTLPSCVQPRKFKLWTSPRACTLLIGDPDKSRWRTRLNAPTICGFATSNCWGCSVRRHSCQCPPQTLVLITTSVQPFRAARAVKASTSATSAGSSWRSNPRRAKPFAAMSGTGGNRPTHSRGSKMAAMCDVGVSRTRNRSKPGIKRRPLKWTISRLSAMTSFLGRSLRTANPWQRSGDILFGRDSHGGGRWPPSLRDFFIAIPLVNDSSKIITSSCDKGHRRRAQLV